MAVKREMTRYIVDHTGVDGRPKETKTINKARRTAQPGATVYKIIIRKRRANNITDDIVRQRWDVNPDGSWKQTYRER